MKKIILLLILGPMLGSMSFAQESCLSQKSLLALDLEFEQAQLDANVDFFNTILAEEFIWIHNHASLTDDKSAVVNRAIRQKENGQENARSRNSQDVKVIILGKTGIVTGTTIVDRGPSPTVYNFMRTYVEIDGQCYLLSNHTMAVPEEE